MLAVMIMTPVSTDDFSSAYVYWCFIPDVKFIKDSSTFGVFILYKLIENGLY